MGKKIKFESYASPYKVCNSRNFDVRFLDFENSRDTRLPRPERFRK